MVKDLKHEKDLKRAPLAARRKERSNRNGWSVIAWAHLAAIAGVLFARHGLAESTWWSTLLLYAPPVCFAIPLALLLPAALSLKDRATLLILAVSILLLLGPVMGAVGHVPLARTPAGDKRARLLSYNIRSGEYGFGHTASHVRRYRPDVVVFSEARELRAIATLPPVMRELMTEWSCAYGDDVFIASRWPIVAREVKSMGGSASRSRVRATVRSPHGDFHVIGVHYYTHLLSRRKAVNENFPRVMADSGEARLRQTRDVLAAVDKLEGPVLLAGDFNNPPAGKSYAMLRERFEDSHRSGGWGWGYTFPSAFPVWRIDYIFYNSWWNIVRTEVGSAPGSDHRPVFAEFSLDGTVSKRKASR